MRKTVKIKLLFAPSVSKSERVKKLKKWASGTHRGARIEVLEEQHFANMSFIIIKNPLIK
ncbi:MAG: hypothetical protein CSB01_00260 [Bacteroidia bacterium]|nr:MAG: hypothetical protein CSB01_00260 [Bacteroidia bacterium]